MKNERREFYPKQAPINDSLRKSLEIKRIVLSPEIDIRQRLNHISEAVEKLKVEFPRIIGLVVFGSHTKGYATKYSDIDGYLFYDKFDDPASVETDSLGPEAEFTRQASEKLQDLLRKNESELNDMVLFPVNADYILETIEQFPDSLFMFFLLSVGDGIKPYRKIIFDELQKMGERGQYIWSIIMEELWRFESVGLDMDLTMERRKLYPQNLEEGRKYFRS